MSEGLNGIRLLEVAGGVGVAYVAKLFADLGVDVVRLEGSDDRVRSRPHDVHRWLNANKRSATSGLAELAIEADILLHDHGPSAAAARGLEYDVLAAARPDLVVCSMTPFGMTGPYADYVAEELTTIHGSSWGFLSPSAASEVELPPLKAPGHHSTIMVANVAAMAALAAFDRADRTGVGEHVDFSVFAASAKMTETAPGGVSFLGTDASRLGVKTVLPWGIYQCADGHVQLVCPEQSQWESLLKLMGEPDWARLDVFADNVGRQDNSDLLDLYLSEWMATQKVDELFRNAQAARLCLSPVNTMSQLDADEHFEARGFFANTPDGQRVPGPGFQTDKPWWRMRRAAPERGETDGERWIEREVSARPDAPAEASNGLLDGVRVCDFTWIWAGPFCTQYLGHLGADVIRLESPEHLCLFRRLPFNPPDTELGPNTAGIFQLYNSDKRSVGIDLGHDEAREIVRRIVAVSDIVIDNFGVGVMAELGFGVDDLREINPDVIVISLSGYGQTGPFADYMAYGPAGGAVAGLYAANGYEGGDPRETGVAVGDPGTGITAAWAAVAALVARRRNGEVARVDVAMVEAVAATCGEAWMERQIEGGDPAPRGNRDPQWAPHGCYPAKGEDTWVTIACTSEDGWRSLCTIIDPALADDDRFATMAARKTNENDLDAVIAAWSSERDRWEVTHALQAAGVASFPSLSPMDLWVDDPQLAALGMCERPTHPATGVHTVPGVPWRLTNGPNGLRRPAPMLGEHTREVLIDLLDYTGADVDRLLENGALW